VRFFGHYMLGQRVRFFHVHSTSWNRFLRYMHGESESCGLVLESPTLRALVLSSGPKAALAAAEVQSHSHSNNIHTTLASSIRLPDHVASTVSDQCHPHKMATYTCRSRTSSGWKRWTTGPSNRRPCRSHQEGRSGRGERMEGTSTCKRRGRRARR